MDGRLWSRYALAREEFEADPSFENEAAVIACYATFARQAHPEHAQYLITLLCGNLADIRRASRG